MDNRIGKLYETAHEICDFKSYYFHFKSNDDEDIAIVIWDVCPSTGKQLFELDILNGEPVQLRDLLIAYLSAKQFAEHFDFEAVTFIFEQFAVNEDIEIICE